MEMISFEEFKKMDIRTAKILDVQEHPNADKLYILKIDLGNEERQLVAGIRQYYAEKDNLIGKDIVIIANLQPRTIRGIESQGMMLAAHDQSGISILVTDRQAAAGSAVS